MSSKSRHYASPPKNAQEAENSKHQGNLLFQKQKYAAACELYTEAILQSEQKWHVPYLNRAMANEKRLRWKEAKEDLEFVNKKRIREKSSSSSATILVVRAFREVRLAMITPRRFAFACV